MILTIIYLQLCRVVNTARHVIPHLYKDVRETLGVNHDILSAAHSGRSGLKNAPCDVLT